MPLPINKHRFIALDLQNVSDQLNAGFEVAFQHRRLLFIGEVLGTMFNLNQVSAPDGSNMIPDSKAPQPDLLGVEC